MITFPRLSKPRQKINLLIAALFVAVQLPFTLIAITPVEANNGRNQNNNANNENGGTPPVIMVQSKS